MIDVQNNLLLIASSLAIIPVHMEITHQRNMFLHFHYDEEFKHATLTLREDDSQGAGHIIAVGEGVTAEEALVDLSDKLAKVIQVAISLEDNNGKTKEEEERI